jgi:hypothetical protein
MWQSSEASLVGNLPFVGNSLVETIPSTYKSEKCHQLVIVSNFKFVPFSKSAMLFLFDNNPISYWGDTPATTQLPYVVTQPPPPPVERVTRAEWYAMTDWHR